MIDPDAKEMQALNYASDMAGEYLEAVGKTDVAKMSREEWGALIGVVVGNYCTRLAEIEAAECPF